jgi:hypothetical protein
MEIFSHAWWFATRVVQTDALDLFDGFRYGVVRSTSDDFSLKMICEGS